MAQAAANAARADGSAERRRSRRSMRRSKARRDRRSARMQDDLKKLHGKDHPGRQAQGRDAAAPVQNARRRRRFPAAQPQERAVGFVYFLNRYGPALVDRLNEELPLDQGLTG